MKPNGIHVVYGRLSTVSMDSILVIKHGYGLHVFCER